MAEKRSAWWDNTYIRWLLLPVAYMLGLFLTARALADIIGDTESTSSPENFFGVTQVGALLFVAICWQIATTKNVTLFRRCVLAPYVFVAAKYIVGWLSLALVAIPLLFVAISEEALRIPVRTIMNLGGLASVYVWWRVTKSK
ncbi:MAG: hypothetical protein MK000_03410 [Anaerolineales bacterium]|nr:hypothetical protein [Anaerolineales bacterium]|tara:strand:+ start:306 stop:734 length:429 start_codon:yes stop_codon:yes gene_type:complete